ncbi:DEAD/DEAH box helicase family protein [Kiloniella majae]|uniref:DEAD/DEAH box helicase family protein n=1 Tax=Kiloniella majae TaxID=1938558 RepID=UPI000A278437|nr:DEAD/DEAH box helicase family protein [Kiloniella majae]
MSNSNFQFLSQHWVFLVTDAQAAEKYALSDPRAASIYARRTLELSLKWLYKNDSALRAPYEKSLAAMIHEPTFSQAIKKGLFFDIKFIHKLGNVAAHSDQRISAEESVKAVQALHQFLGWLARVYTRGGAKPDEFNQGLVPKSGAQMSQQQLAKVQLVLKAKDEKTAAAEAKLSQTEDELAKLKAELTAIQEVKQTNAKTIKADEYSEAQTRELIIDVMLREASWNPKGDNVEEYEVTGMPTKSGERKGTGYVDYVLWGKDNKPVALVEAKCTRIDPKQGKRQAELYADCLEEMHGQRPIIYYSNGYTTWIWDDQFYPPREVQGFSTRDELQWKINQRTERKELTAMKPKQEIAGRYYQMEAAARVMDSFGNQRKRKSLIVMATGTGKTRLSIAMVDMLMRAGWARKVLFLADRVALVNQAKRAFKSNLPHVSVASLLDKKEEEARITFSTYPTMLNCIDGTKKDQKEIFSAGHFDLIIIDEAHRSVYQKYGAIFDYFDSLLLGLTATPRGEVDRNTYKLFELDDHQPTYSYELETAVEDEFLVPPRAISVPLKFQREGIKYNELTPEEQEEYELQEEFYDKETGELIEEIGSPALNKWLFNIDTVNKVLAHLMENGIKVEGGDKLGKTIIFAKNSKHADFIVEQFDKNYSHLAGKFCRKVDYSVKYAQSLIDDFSVKKKDPQIVVSVDMLDTGIDVPEVVNLVFFKIVRSKTKFWQMIGRGTRLCEDLFAIGEDKKEFIVFDYCQNFEFFDENPDGYDTGAQESVKQKIFKRRLELTVALHEQDVDEELSTDLKNQMHGVVSAMDIDNFIVRKQRKEIETYVNRKKWDDLSEQDIEALNGKVSGLPSHDEDDEFARRFDLLILNLQVAIFKKSSAQESYILKIRKIASGLEDKSSIPTVKAQMELILDLQTDTWWQDVSLAMLEQVRLKLRDLIKFIDKEEGISDVFTNFEDELGEVNEDHQLVKTDADMAEYRKRVQRFINDHSDHLTIRRLKNNEPISRADIQALENIFFTDDGPISRQEYEDLYGDKPLGILVRSVVGLSRKAAKEAFAEFLSEAPMHPDQISFLDQIVDYLVKNGTMEPKAMFDAPFTHINEQGVTGLFNEDESKKVVELVRHINRNARSIDKHDKASLSQAL